MKYIKLFEEYNTITVFRPVDYKKLSDEDKFEIDNAKYQLGDSVLWKIGGSGSAGIGGSNIRAQYHEEPYTIEGIQIAILNDTKIISYLILDKDNLEMRQRRVWVQERQLIAEYELDANKYNL